MLLIYAHLLAKLKDLLVYSIANQTFFHKKKSDTNLHRISLDKLS